MATKTNHSLHEQSEGFKSLSAVPSKPCACWYNKAGWHLCFYHAGIKNLGLQL